MKVLLDECVPRRLKFRLTGHDCLTVPEAGFAGKTNGELLALAEESGFEVFVTADGGIPYQQSLTSRKIGIVLLRAKSNQYADLLPLVGECLERIQSLIPGKIEIVEDSA